MEKLRKSRSFNAQLSLIALEEGRVLGHILFSPITIETKKGSFPALALAPMAVHPEFQTDEDKELPLLTDTKHGHGHVIF